MGTRTILKTAIAHRAVSVNRSYRKLLIDGKTKLFLEKNAQIINNGYFAMGVRRDGFFPSDKRCMLTIQDKGKLVLNGSTITGPGVTIIVGPNASLELGNNVCINSNATIIANQKIKIGDGSGIGWDSEIIDTDFHPIIREGATVSASSRLQLAHNLGGHVPDGEGRHSCSMLALC